MTSGIAWLNSLQREVKELQEAKERAEDYSEKLGARLALLQMLTGRSLADFSSEFPDGMEATLDSLIDAFRRQENIHIDRHGMVRLTQNRGTTGALALSLENAYAAGVNLSGFVRRMATTNPAASETAPQPAFVCDEYTGGSTK